MPFQYGNEANPRAHYEGTGAEIADALPQVDALVAGLGTGGTLMGAGDRLRESFPDLIVAAAEPLQGDLVYGLRSLADGYVPPDPRRLEARPEGARHERGVGRRAARCCSSARRSSPASPPARSSTSPAGSPRSSTKASSSPSSPTAAGSTSPPTSGRARPARSARRWRTASGGDPGRGALGARRARRGGAPERGLRPDRAPRRRRRALLPGPEPRRQPVPLRARDRPRGLVPRGRRLRAGRLPLAPASAPRGRRAPTSRTSASGRAGPT